MAARPAPTAYADLYSALERQRRAALKSYLGGIVFAITAVVIALIAPLGLINLVGDGWRDNPSAPYALLIWPLAWLFAAGWAFKRFAQRPKWAYHGAYKARVLTAACAEHFPGIAYISRGGMSYDIIDRCGLFAHVSDEYSSEDRFEGRWGSTDIEFAEARAQRRRRKLTNKGLVTVYEEYFRGIIFIADFHKHFHSTTRIAPRRAELPKRSGETPLALEDPQFTRAFAATTTDQVDARYVLSTSFVERLTALNRKFPGLRAKFSEDKLLLFLPSRKDRFECSLLRPAGSARQIDAFVQDVRACLAVVDELNLNTRIWSKA